MAHNNYATEVMKDGPIGYWRLAELPGTMTAADASGNVHKHNGTYYGGILLGQPGFQWPKGDRAALFDGATGRIIVPNHDDLNPSQITMEAKVRWNGPTWIEDQEGIRLWIQQRILEKSFFIGGQQAQYGLSILSDGRVCVELRAGGGPSKVNSVAPALLNVETHVAATYDGSMIRIYINGIPDSAHAPTFPGDIQAEARPGYDLGIGNQAPLERLRSFNGLIDEVALFGKPLTEERIRAHYQSQFKETGGFQYAVKFVCGKSAGTVVAPGTYFTAVNVHNPTYMAIGFRAKIAVALPGLTPGPVSKFFDAKLGPDEALEIDCPDIFKYAETRADFLKGFVVIESDVELDVVAVYTAAGRDGQVETLHTERVPLRRLELGPPDLIPVSDEISTNSM